METTLKEIMNKADDFQNDLIKTKEKKLNQKSRMK